MKKYITSALIGMGFGFPITLLCMITFGGYQEVLREFLVWMGASALYGILSVAMDNEKWNLSFPLSLGLHAFGCIAITAVAALLCGYISSVADILPVFIPAIGIYVVVCLISFLLMKQNEKKVNKALEEK